MDYTLYKIKFRVDNDKHVKCDTISKESVRYARKEHR